MKQGHWVKVMEFAAKIQSMQLSSCRGEEQAFQKDFRGLQDNLEVHDCESNNGRRTKELRVFSSE